MEASLKDNFVDKHFNKVNSKLLSHFGVNMPDGLCGIQSLCLELERQGINYDIDEILAIADFYKSKDGRDGEEGYLWFDIYFAASQIKDVRLDIYFNLKDLFLSKDAEESLPNTIKLLKNQKLKINPPISLDIILSNINENISPIIGFYVNGDETKGHFSPIKNFNDIKIWFELPNEDNVTNCDVNSFINDWWNHDSFSNCLMIGKKTL